MSITEAEGVKMLSGHVVLFPFPAAGHIAPFIPFAKSLARYGVAITFMCPKNEISKLKRSITEDESFDARENVILVPFEIPTEDGLDLVTFDVLKHFMYKNVEKFDEIIAHYIEESRSIKYPSRSSSGPPVCIVSDMFMGFTQGTAEKFSIVRYCLFASPVHFLSLLFHLPKFNDENLIPVKKGDKPLMIPNFPPIPAGDLPPSQQADNGNPGSHFFLLNETKQMWKAAGVLVNSVEEIERPVLEGLQRYIDETMSGDQGPKISTFGPLVDGCGEGKLSLRDKLREMKEGGDWYDWLSQQPDSSVLYMCFGTVAMLSDEQIRQMAIALENSGQRFFWALRLRRNETGAPQDVSRVFPEGFLQRTKSKGLVYFDWAPQLHILAHRAIKGFVTHCGWNSTMESILMGVPTIGWPMQAEQMLNAIFLDKVLGISIRINKTAGWKDMISSDTFERAIHTLMVDPSGETMKAKVLQISDTVEKAARPGGSSRINLESFVQDVRRMASGGVNS